MTDLPTNEIHLWTVHDQENIDSALLDRYLSIISQDEVKRYRRFLFQRHQRQFLITRALVRTVLAQYLPDTRAEQLVFARNEHGKPRIASFGQPAGIHFNLSHADGLIILAVTGIGELGVDVEFLTRQVDILKLAERFFSSREADDLKALPASEFNDRFFDLWTLKEAYIKACGKGLAIPLSEFSFTFDGTLINIDFAEHREDDPGLWAFWQKQFGEDYKLALAIKGRELEKTRIICRTGLPLVEFEEVDSSFFRSSWGEWRSYTSENKD